MKRTSRYAVSILCLASAHGCGAVPADPGAGAALRPSTLPPLFQFFCVDQIDGITQEVGEEFVREFMADIRSARALGLSFSTVLNGLAPICEQNGLPPECEQKDECEACTSERIRACTDELVRAVFAE